MTYATAPVVVDVDGSAVAMEAARWAAGNRPEVRGSARRLKPVVVVEQVTSAAQLVWRWSSA